jgi:hypothetical protein
MSRTVTRDARRRWAAVAAVALVVVALPLVAGALPVRAAAVSVTELYDRIRASARLPYQGYAVSTGRTGLPSLPQLGDVARLFNGDTQLRVWYAAPDRWRVDVIDLATERDVYQSPDRQSIWDYGGNQLTEVIGTAPVRLPRGADLVPPDLARRLLSASAGPAAGQLTPLPARRVAGVVAAGLRLTPADARTTIGQVDVWADPASGLPLQVAVTARGAGTPILVSQFLEISLEISPAGPDPSVLTPPAPRAGIGYTVTGTQDIVAGLTSVRPGPLPDRLAGLARSAASPAGQLGVGGYGDGLAQFVVLSVPRQVGVDATRSATRAGGAPLTFPGGSGVLVSTPVLAVLVLSARSVRRTYLLAGLVGGDLLKQAGVELSTYRP